MSIKSNCIVCLYILTHIIVEINNTFNAPLRSEFKSVVLAYYLGKEVCFVSGRF